MDNHTAMYDYSIKLLAFTQIPLGYFYVRTFCFYFPFKLAGNYTFTVFASERVPYRSSCISEITLDYFGN